MNDQKDTWADRYESWRSNLDVSTKVNSKVSHIHNLLKCPILKLTFIHFIHIIFRIEVWLKISLSLIWSFFLFCFLFLQLSSKKELPTSTFVSVISINKTRHQQDGLSISFRPNGLANNVNLIMKSKSTTNKAEDALETLGCRKRMNRLQCQIFPSNAKHSAKQYWAQC